MYITVKQLANKVNNLERFSLKELNMGKIEKITVEITNNGTNINYLVDDSITGRECYTENTVLHSIIYLMNHNRPVQHEKNNTRELIVYVF